MKLTVEMIKEARKRLLNSIYYSPCPKSQTLSDIAGCHVYCKLENLQMTGSFKERGALSRLKTLTAEEKERGVIAASAGNHAQGIAYHAARLGIACTIVMPEYTPLIKVVNTRRSGANVIVQGNNYDATQNMPYSFKKRMAAYLFTRSMILKLWQGRGQSALRYWSKLLM